MKSDKNNYEMDMEEQTLTLKCMLFLLGMYTIAGFSAYVRFH